MLNFKLIFSFLSTKQIIKKNNDTKGMIIINVFKKDLKVFIKINFSEINSLSMKKTFEKKISILGNNKKKMPKKINTIVFTINNLCIRFLFLNSLVQLFT